MVERRLILLLVMLLMGASMATAQTVHGRTSHHPRTSKRPAPRGAVYVAICESRSAYAYHSGMCRGLARCTHGVSQVTVAQAQGSGYRPCKICQ